MAARSDEEKLKELIMTNKILILKMPQLYSNILVKDFKILLKKKYRINNIV